jgi:tetratricopeptide (TPR) repeat protein
VTITRTQNAPTAHRLSAPGLGERLRQLRVAAGLTQSELAGERFSKEYVSQIERGKTPASAAAVTWFADRLEIDAAFLVNGVRDQERARLEWVVTHAEALLQRGDREAARGLLGELQQRAPTTGADDVLVRGFSAEAQLRLGDGDPRGAVEALSKARDLVEGPTFSDLDRAQVIYRMGICRYELGSIATATALFTQALELAERADIPDDLLRSKVLGWRSRCYRRQRDLEAAREDVESALELAEASSDLRRLADALFNASLIEERSGRLIQARRHAERAMAYYESISDHANIGKLQNNLGGLHFLLGRHDDARTHLKAAVAAAIEVGNRTDAAQALTSLAQVYLGLGERDEAERHVRHALTALSKEDQPLYELGMARLVLGEILLQKNALREADALFVAADGAFEQLSSLSHRAKAWVGRGDVRAQSGDAQGAARFYRKAADALQDVRF